MPLLVILTMRGQQERLAEAAQRFTDLAPAPPGLVARFLATTEDGGLLVTVWVSEQARSGWHHTDDYGWAMARSGVGDAIDDQDSRSYPLCRSEIFPDPPSDTRARLLDRERPA
jgi:hypothetical protein